MFLVISGSTKWPSGSYGSSSCCFGVLSFDRGDWSLSGGSTEYLAYNFATGTAKGYQTERIAPVKRQKVDDGLVVAVVAFTVDVDWFLGVAHKTIFQVEHDFWRYCGTVEDDASQPANVPAGVMDDLEDVFEQKVLWKGDSGSSFTADDWSVIAVALARLSKTDPALESSFVNTEKWLVDKLETSPAATVKAERKIEHHEGLVSEAEKSKKNALNDVASLCGRFTVADTREVEVSSDASATSNEMAKATGKLRQARDTISTQSKKLAGLQS